MQSKRAFMAEKQVKRRFSGFMGLSRALKPKILKIRMYKLITNSN
jgi:hypothetical protein